MNSNADVNPQSSPEKTVSKLKEKRKKKKEMVFKSPVRDLSQPDFVFPDPLQEMVPTSESESEESNKKLGTQQKHSEMPNMTFSRQGQSASNEET